MRWVSWLLENKSFEIKSLRWWHYVLIGSTLVAVFLLVRWLMKWLTRLLRGWGAALRERRTKRLTAKAVDLRDDQPYDLIFLHQRGFVRARGTGRSITEVYAQVENLIKKRLHVVVKPGTYFVSSGSHQNMVTRTEYSFTLYPCSTEHISMSASCINANRPIPKRSDRFYGVKRVSGDLARFLETTQNADSMVVQAGVWAITDGYSAHDVQTRLVSRDQFGRTWRAVSDAQIAEARRILGELGIHHNL